MEWSFPLRVGRAPLQGEGRGVGLLLMEVVFESARRRGLPGLIIKAHRISRSYFEHQGLERKSAGEGEDPWQYWKGL